MRALESTYLYGSVFRFISSACQNIFRLLWTQSSRPRYFSLMVCLEANKGYRLNYTDSVSLISLFYLDKYNLSVHLSQGKGYRSLCFADGGQMAAASLMANFHFLKVNSSLPQNRQRSSDKHSVFAFKIGLKRVRLSRIVCLSAPEIRRRIQNTA